MGPFRRSASLGLTGHTSAHRGADPQCESPVTGDGRISIDERSLHATQSSTGLWRPVHKLAASMQFPRITAHHVMWAGAVAVLLAGAATMAFVGCSGDAIVPEPSARAPGVAEYVDDTQVTRLQVAERHPHAYQDWL